MGACIVYIDRRILGSARRGGDVRCAPAQFFFSLFFNLKEYGYFMREVYMGG